MNYFYILFLLVLVVACKATIDVKNETEILIQTDKEFALYSIENGAAEAFNHYLSEDALQLPAGQSPVQGKRNIYNNMRQNQYNYTLNWSPQYAEVSESGELGYTWGTYTVTYFDESDAEQKSYGKYLNIWKKQKDGSWNVAVDMGNASPEP